MGEKDDGLTLSLSLKCPEINHDSPLSRLPPPPPPPAPAKQSPAPVATPFPLNLLNSGQLPFLHRHNHHHHQKASLPFAFQSSSDLNAEARSYARGIDVNRTATAAECEEDAVVSSPNSTVSSVSGKRAEREENNYEAAERDSSSHGVSEEEDDGGDAAAAAARKKLRLSKDQAAVLEETFKEHNTLNPKQKLALAKQLDLRPRQVEVWFQNRRARTKLKQTEVDCEYLKRCCETLTEENRRLQKEVNELRALKLSPQFYMNMSPPTTLTMCPQCERVAVASSSSVGATSSTPGVSGITKALHQPAGNPQHQTPVPLIPRPSIIPHPPQRPRW